MKNWPDLLAECIRLLSEAEAKGSSGERLVHCPPRPEAAFRINLRENSGGKSLESVVGGIPKIVTSAVHVVTPRLSSRWLPPEGSEQPIGVLTRGPRREDLYVFYRECDASLVLYTLPEKFQSKVILVPLENDDVIRQAGLGENVSRVEFSTLKPGRYLVASFSMVDLDALQRQALQLRQEGMFSEALALLEEVLELDPQHFLAWTRKGYVLRGMDRRGEAMEAVEEALKINAQFAFAWRAKGALLRDAGKHQEGLNCYLRSLELDPTDFLCWENKGNALMALGKEAEGKEAYAKAREMREQYPEEKH
ncbi:MAG TPA: tetratricopeptide repeat protein [Candidatus Acidoferrum sp.]|nr:tetratricopeptide repeat protein [Candidatus Acidoferrum sp.]